MFSLCRLCADCKDLGELKTEIAQLESKLVLCCGWYSSTNEDQMPPKACDACVEEVERSWRFAESVKAAESKLNKFISDHNQLESLDHELLTTSVDVTFLESIKKETDITPIMHDVEIDEFERYEGDEFHDDPAKYSETESSHSSKCTNEKTNRKVVKQKRPSVDLFLDYLKDGDRLADGAISANGVAKLETLFPEMKSMGWTECEYKCNKCNRVFKGPHNFFAHNRSLHFDEVQNMVFRCFYCKSKHRREYTLSQHMASKHFPHLKFRCWYCTDYFWDNSELIKHRNMHSNIEYLCELCNQVFMSRDILYSHISQLHQKRRWGPDPETKFTCDICKKDFATKWSIKSHMLQHIKKFDYVCDQCGWKFLTKGNLKGHLQTTHSDVKNFVCKECNGRFKTKHQLANHAKRHEEFKPFACKVCDRRFRQAYGLTVHMRCHNNTFTYSCKYCDRKFRHTSSLKTHERIHTAEKPYRCSVCEYRSTNWPNLNKHSVRIHSIDLRTKNKQETQPQPAE